MQVVSEDYSSTELAGSDEHESGTLGNAIAINDLYENVDVAENRNNLVDDRWHFFYILFYTFSLFVLLTKF